MKGTNNKRQKIISVFYEEYRKKILTEFDFEAVVNGAMVETIDGNKVKIDKIDKEKRRIYGFIFNEDRNEWGTESWWDKNGYLLGWKELKSYTARENLAILNYSSLVKNEVKKNKCKKIIKPFNLDAALNGTLVETRDGREVEIEQIMNHPSYNENCIFAYINYYNGSKKNRSCYWWCSDGRKYKNEDSDYDLVIVEYVQIRGDKSTVKSIDIDGLNINLV